MLQMRRKKNSDSYWNLDSVGYLVYCYRFWNILITLICLPNDINVN